MKVLSSLLLLLILSPIAKCQNISDSLLNVLKTEIAKEKIYDDNHEHRLENIRRVIATVPANNFSARYALYDQLYEGYKDYNFDSAHVYITRLLDVSKQTNDLSKQYISTIKLDDIQLSRSMHKEVFDDLYRLDTRLLPDSIKLEYYFFKSRALIDLAAYNSDEFYSPANRASSINALDSAALLSKPGSFEKRKLTAQLLIYAGQNAKAAAMLYNLFHDPNISAHQRAMVAIDLSYLTDSVESARLITLAAIYDIRSCTKQTLAIFSLGKILLKQGRLADAELILTEAFTQAHFYGNRLRETEINIVLAQLAAQQLINAENNKNDVLKILIGIVSLALMGIAFVSYRVYTRLKQVKIREAVIRGKYEQLDYTNKKLTEDAHIKEEYIGYFFNIISGYISKLEKIKRNAERRIKTGEHPDMLPLIKEIDIKQERATLFYTFDKIFLKLFPNFIVNFNSFLKPEDQIWPKATEVLNTNLRIFALIRLGIKDSQTIATILETSISTIYTYKNRVKSKSLIPGDDFENEIMGIKFVDFNANASKTDRSGN